MPSIRRKNGNLYMLEFDSGRIVSYRESGLSFMILLSNSSKSNDSHANIELMGLQRQVESQWPPTSTSLGDKNMFLVSLEESYSTIMGLQLEREPVCCAAAGCTNM
ncbi:hypothetical protein TNCV_4547391 [Trichonephila clavipes]|nr:hypothetical protein TNCV_4547391 [Trichonephila clavipes]